MSKVASGADAPSSPTSETLTALLSSVRDLYQEELSTRPAQHRDLLDALETIAQNLAILNSTIYPVTSELNRIAQTLDLLRYQQMQSAAALDRAAASLDRAVLL